MDVTQLDQELRSGKIRPCYLIVGAERHLALTAQKQILKTIFAEAGPSADRFQAGQTPLGKILDCLNTTALLSPWRVVIVEEGNEWKKKDWETIKEYFQKPPEKASLLILAESLGEATLKNIGNAVTLVECKKLYPRQVAAWINMEMRNANLHISQEAARYLAECVGTDLGVLNQAVEKLLLYIGERKLVELQDVEKVVANTAQRSVFDLTNAIGAKNIPQALQLLDRLLDQGEEPIKAFALIVRHFRLLARAQEILEKSGGNVGPNFARDLKVHPFFAKDYAVQSKHFKKEGWKKCFATLFACDRSLKSSRNPRQIILEKLIWELCAH